MAGMHYLSDEEVKLLQWVLDFARRMQSGGNAHTQRPVDEAVSSDVYIALTPSQGIPILQTAAGTGSFPEGTGDLPGSAICQIYQIVNGSLVQVPSGMTKTVYNLTTVVIAGFSWVLIQKDKFGNWVVTPTTVAARQPLAGKCITSPAQGTVADVEIWVSGNGVGTGTNAMTDTGGVSSWFDLVDSGLTQSALFLLGAGIAGNWIVLLPWQYGYLAVNMECDTTGTGT